MYIKAISKDINKLAYICSEAFNNDPIFNYIIKKEGVKKFFIWLLNYSIKYAEIWTNTDYDCCAIWFPPNSKHIPSIIEFFKLIPVALKFCNLISSFKILKSIIINTPKISHYYLAILAVLPSRQHNGIGKDLLSLYSNCKIYLENTNIENLSFYKKNGFVEIKNIAPVGAPPLVSMWKY